MKQEQQYITKGHEVLDKSKWELWDEIVPIRLDDLYRGMELDCTLELEEILKTKSPEAFKKAREALGKQGHSGMSWGLMRSMVVAFCTNGKEFEEKHMRL